MKVVRPTKFGVPNIVKSQLQEQTDCSSKDKFPVKTALICSDLEETHVRFPCYTTAIRINQS